MPRGSNSTIEVARVKNQEDPSTGILNKGNAHGVGSPSQEIKGFSNRNQINKKNPRRPY